MEVLGAVRRIGETQQISASFKKREIVVTTQEQYPQHISIEFTQDKVDLLDAFREGQNVAIGINLRGREWTSPAGEVKFFNTIQGWRIDAVQAAAPAQPLPAAPAPTDPLAPQASDLPF